MGPSSLCSAACCSAFALRHVPLQSTLVGCTRAAGFLAELRCGTACSPSEQSTSLATGSGRQKATFQFALDFFPIVCLWCITFLLLLSENGTAPGSCYESWVMERFHHLPTNSTATQDPCSICLLSAPNTCCYDYSMKTRILLYLREWKGLQRVKTI